MKQKNFQTILYSTAGVIIMFILLLAFYVVSSGVKQRIDLTKERAFTLSQGTRNIIKRVDSRLTIRFYCTQDDATMPPVLKTYANHVEDLLGEYKEASKGKIVVQKLNPKPDSDAEDSARLDGVNGQQVNPFGDKIYLGIVVSMLDEKIAIPWLDPNHERLLEYDISRAISRVLNPTPPLIGVMSAMPILGEEANPMMAQMGRQSQATPPATFISEIKKDFTVREVPMTSTKIDDDLKVLLVVQPRDITDAAQYAIDQFVLRGGKLLAFLDPHAYFDQKHDQMAQVLGESSGQSSLDKLLKGWGLSMDIGKVVADKTFAWHGQNGAAVPTVLALTTQGINADDVVTSQIDNLLMLFPGAFTGTPTSGLTETVLLHSSLQAQLVDGMTASIGAEQINQNFKTDNKAYPLAVRLTGRFKTAFPDGAPKSGTNQPAQPSQLKEATGNGVVILVGDSDMLADQACVQVQEFLGYRMVRPINGNLNLVQSLVEQLSGDNDLITLRSRASLDRPFTRLKDMQAKAGQAWEAEEKTLEASKAETERKISELQQRKSGSEQRFILSPDQQKELENYQKTVADSNKQLKQVRKNLAKDTDALEFHTKVINIGLMPVLVAITGIALAIVKRKRTAAK